MYHRLLNHYLLKDIYILWVLDSKHKATVNDSVKTCVDLSFHSAEINVWGYTYGLQLMMVELMIFLLYDGVIGTQ